MNRSTVPLPQSTRHRVEATGSGLARKFHTPSEEEEQTVLWGRGAPAPVSEQNGARAPHPHEIFRLTKPLPQRNRLKRQYPPA
jgi:hypothetical protein